MGSEAVLRKATPSDFPAILRLNAEFEHFLSPLTPTGLLEIHGLAANHKVIVAEGEMTAFLLAFREGTDYDSPNYRWFSRYPIFLYIDRVVCEFDLRPPNDLSRQFHGRFGFREVGTQWVAGHTKQVSLQEALL